MGAVILPHKFEIEFMKNNRRNFLKNAGVMLGFGLSLPVVSSLTSSCDKNEGPLINSNKELDINVADYPGLANIGGSAKVKDTNFNSGASVIVIRKTDKEYVTYTSTCTHQGCEVDLPNNEKMQCGCHGSIFSVNAGEVLGKPFDGTDIKPLPMLQNSFDEVMGILTIYS